jgi:hypothetical protein
LSYGTQFAMLSDMLQHTTTRPRTARMLPSADFARARISPWLSWRPKKPRPMPVLSVAELSECTCPDICHRDHANV